MNNDTQQSQSDSSADYGTHKTGADTRVADYAAYKNKQQIEDEAIEWFVLLESGDVTDAQKNKFQQWIIQSPSHQQLFDEVKQSYNLLDPSVEKGSDIYQASDAFVESLLVNKPQAAEKKQTCEGKNTDQSTSKPSNSKPSASKPITSKPSSSTSVVKNKQAKPFYQRWSVAAAFVLTTVGTLLSYQAFNQQPKYQHFFTQKGEAQKHQLADGSSIQLNTASELQVSLDKELRQVNLIDGEAFFDVAHDKSRPFEITAGDTKVRVLGTKFSVNYKGDKVEVTVLEGKVQVIEQQSLFAKLIEAPESKLLTANQKITHRHNAEQSALSGIVKTNSDVALSWRNGQLIFDDTPLYSVINEVNRYLKNAQIKLADSRLSNIKINAVFKQGDANAVIDGLAVFLPVSAQKLPNGTIIIKHR